MTTSPEWDAARTPIAFIVAPLVVPLAFGAWAEYYRMTEGEPFSQAEVVILALVALFTYGGVIILGIPAYLLLRARNLTAFWISAVAGFLAGATTHAATIAIIAPSATPASVLLASLKFGGLSGAAVGTILWLIARPDRPTHQQSQGPQSEA